MNMKQVYHDKHKHLILNSRSANIYYQLNKNHASVVYQYIFIETNTSICVTLYHQTDDFLRGFVLCLSIRLRRPGYPD